LLLHNIGTTNSTVQGIVIGAGAKVLFIANAVDDWEKISNSADAP
jgi:hypothetical protein